VSEMKATHSKPAGLRSPQSRDSGTDLVPANPITGRKAFIQVALLGAIPLLMLILFRYALRRFFPSLGY